MFNEDDELDDLVNIPLTKEEVANIVIAAVEEQSVLLSGVTANTTFDELDFDSLDMLDLVMYVEDDLDISLDHTAWAWLKTVGDLIQHAVQKLGIQ